MKEIVERLTENRNIERAKQILESNGYKVSKKLSESEEPIKVGKYNLEPINPMRLGDNSYRIVTGTPFRKTYQQDNWHTFIQAAAYEPADWEDYKDQILSSIKIYAREGKAELFQENGLVYVCWEVWAF